MTHDVNRAPAPIREAGWFPDPARTHEARYFDGDGWTDHVTDAGLVTQAPLGPPPPGLMSWFPPELVTMPTPVWNGRPIEVPRLKMWILAILSSLVFWSHSPGSTFVLPIGLAFAVWCWRMTDPVLQWHESVHSPAVTEIKAARWVAVGFALVCVLQCVNVLR
jgi:hypothetical protein